MLKFADRAGGGRSGSHAWNQICFSDSSFHTWNPICFSDREIRGGGRCPAAGRIGDVLAASTQGGAEPRARKRGIGWRSSAREAGAPRERSGPQFHGGARQGAAQVILGIGMTAGKARAAAAEEGVDLAVRRTAAQQFLSDPLVGNAPVGIGEALRNVESAQPSRIDGSRCGGGQGEVAWSENRGDGGESGPVACAELGLGRLHQCGQCGATPDCACSSFTQGA